MLLAWLKKRAEKKEVAKKIAENEYLTRLKNSANGFCGTRHFGPGPFLSLREFESLIWAELKRRTESQHCEVSGAKGQRNA